MARKEYKFDFSMFTYVLDIDNADAKIFQGGKDITKAAMNRPLVELLVAYDALMCDFKEAKQLLRLAVDAIYKARQGECCSICNIPKDDLKRCEVDFDSQDCKFIWKYSDNVEWLLNEGEGTSDL